MGILKMPNMSAPKILNIFSINILNILSIRQIAWTLALVVLVHPYVYATDFAKLNSKLRAKFTDIAIMSVDDAYQIIHQNKGGEADKFALILDARTAKEFAVSHIQGAMNTPDADAAINLLSNSGANKNARILIYCSLGYRSGDLVRKLKQQGYTGLINMEGSLFEWVEKDYPVYQAGTLVTKVHPYNLWWGKNLRQDYRSYSP